MDQYSHYLMLMKSKHMMINSRFERSSNNSWEEQAFAEDVAVGPLGGFMWPPRSYSCSFCKREFRSAQALGGHMNVHRRDRARLKQSLGPSETTQLLDIHLQNPIQDHSKSLDSQYPSQVCTLESNQNPNSNPSFASSLHSSSRVSAISTQENFSESTCLSPLTTTTTSIFQDHQERSYVDTNLSVGLNLNLISSQIQPSGDNFHDQSNSCKRHKDTIPFSPFFRERCSSGRFSCISSDVDELDLELRLGDPPKVK